MANNVRYEHELYEPMRQWLQIYLENKYKKSTIITIDSHAKSLDNFLEEYDIVDYFPQAVGLDIQIDVLGIIKNGKQVDIVFIEAKKTQLNLHDLGQLWAYCKLCNPLEAFLLSSHSLGSLNKIINNIYREDILDFGEERTVKKMQVAKWDLTSNSIDYKTLVPKI
jgi:cell division FtsZ-interacting protein ZapD